MKPLVKRQSHRFQDDYQKISQIGRGSYGDVFTAKQKFGQNQIRAIKRISIDPMADDLSEVQKSKVLKNDHIVEYYGYIVQNRSLYIIMNYCKGNLKDQIKKNKKFQPQNIISLLIQITSAMLCLVQKNIMHLDLKPQNILYEEESYYQICDFGCSRLYENFSKNLKVSQRIRMSSYPIMFSDAQPIIGTPRYIAPQVQLSQYQIPRSSCDVWSMGIILYQIVYQKHPFRVNQLQRVETQDFKDFKDGKLQVDFPQTSQKQLIDLIKLMLNPNQFQRISWNKIKKYLISKYGKQQEEFKNIQDNANSQVNVSIIFMCVVFTINNYLTESGNELGQVNKQKLIQIKNILIELGYGMMVKFYRLFQFKIKFKLSANTRVNLEFIYESIKEQFTRQINSQNQQIQILQKELCQKLQQLKSQITYIQKQKWQTLDKFSIFAYQAVEIKKFFCSDKKFKNTCKIYGIQIKD